MTPADPLPAWFDELEGRELEARILAEFGDSLDDC